MLLSEHGLGSLWSVSSTSLNPCHEEIGLFWKHMKLPPCSCVSVRVQITESLHFLQFLKKMWIRRGPLYPSLACGSNVCSVTLSQ